MQDYTSKRSPSMRQSWAWALIAGVFLLAACQPKVYLMPTPLVIGSGEADPFTANPDEAGGRYWNFPPDYPERVARIIRDIKAARQQ
jgi:hypothetical protein